MKPPEQESHNEEFQVFEEPVEPPAKLKNDSELSAREQMAKLSEWLYQQHLSLKQTEIVEDEEKLLNELMAIINRQTENKRHQRETALRELKWLFQSYWPAMFGAGAGIGTAVYLFSKQVTEIMIQADVFLNEKTWEAITNSSLLTEVVSDDYYDTVLDKLFIASIALSVIVTVVGIGMILKEEDKGSLYGFRSSLEDFKSTHAEMKTYAQDFMHLLGIQDSLQLNQEHILSAVQTAAKRIRIREKILAERTQTINRRRHLLERAGIHQNTEMWDRSDDFTEPLEEEVKKTQRRI